MLREIYLAYSEAFATAAGGREIHRLRLVALEFSTALPRSWDGATYAQTIKIVASE
jgi:hypothetical protein